MREFNQLMLVILGILHFMFFLQAYFLLVREHPIKKLTWEKK